MLHLQHHNLYEFAILFSVIESFQVLEEQPEADIVCLCSL